MLFPSRWEMDSYAFEQKAFEEDTIYNNSERRDMYSRDTLSIMLSNIAVKRYSAGSALAFPFPLALAFFFILSTSGGKSASLSL